MATKISKSGPRHITHAPREGRVNAAMPVRPHPAGPQRPKGPTTGQPRKLITFPTAGHFIANQNGNVVRISATGRTPTRPLTPFQGASTPSGNPVVHYSARVGQAQEVPTIKVAGTGHLAMTALPGNDRRHGPQPVNTVMPYSRKLQHGGQAYLPSYKRRKMGSQG